MSATFSNLLAMTGLLLALLSITFLHVDEVATAGIMAVVGVSLFSLAFWGDE